MKKSIYVLGTATSHNGSACLLKDGEIIVAIEKERITRNKADGQNDNLAIQYCLDSAGVRINDIDLVVQNDNFSDFKFGNNSLYGKRLIDQVDPEKIISISHHLAHAYSAHGACFFSDYGTLVIDGCGSPFEQCIDLPYKEKLNDYNLLSALPHLFMEKDSFYECQNNKVSTVYKDFSEWGFYGNYFGYPMHPNSTKHSIGGVYEAASRYCFGNMSDPGKLMGLAPYGRKGQFKEQIFEFKDGRIFVNYDWMIKYKRPSTGYIEFKENFQYYADIACGVQLELERAVLYLVKERMKLITSKNLCLAGGTALNAVANSLIIKNNLVENLYVQPAASDNGLSIGCAYYGWLEHFKSPKIKTNGNTCFGKKYTASEIEESIQAINLGANIIDLNFIICEFFTKLNRAKNLLNRVNSIIQFEIENIGIFQLKATDKIIVKKDIIGKATCVLKAKPDDFYKFLQNPNLFESFVENGVFDVSNHSELPIIRANYNLGVDNILFGEDIYEICKSLKNIKDGKLVYNKYYDIIPKTAELLKKGYIIGWFQDGSEFGPRSLGRRSILADPRNQSVRDFINSNIKFREDFRPFAPSVLREDASIYFEMINQDSPYMVKVFDIKEEYKKDLLCIVHKNNTCRVQTVTNDWSPKFYDLLKEFKSKTGYSVLLNTSFNRRGMPIVETPNQAIDFFLNCSLDYLIIDNFLIGKKDNEINYLSFKNEEIR
jgi:predicted NodU family carbamoyl transferase